MNDMKWDEYSSDSREDAASIWRTAWGVYELSERTFIIQKPVGDEYWIHIWDKFNTGVPPDDHRDIAGPFESLDTAKTAYMILYDSDSSV